MAEKDKKYLSTREAALQLNVAVSTVQSWTDNGLLRAWTTAGGHRRIEKDSVENLMNKKMSGSTEKSGNNSISVVIVEDNEQDLRLYQKQFEAWEMNTDINLATDGFTGLINIGKTSPDIIITDLMMPNMDGFELIKAIKSNSDFEDALIIVVTALTADEINSKGGLPGDVFIFKKPVVFDDLEILIRNKFNLDAA